VVAWRVRLDDGKAGGLRLPERRILMPSEWRTSAGSPDECGSCGGTEFDNDNFCVNCGTRRPASPRHSDIDLDSVAGSSDIGKRHHNNEDAMGLAVADVWCAAIVCDGVSTSSRPDTASSAAAASGIRTMSRELDKVTDFDEAAVTAVLKRAVGAAQAGAALAAGSEVGPNPPSTTLVSAIVSPAGVTVGWIGDSRAYWVPDGDISGAGVLTVDDTLAGQLAAAGVPISDDAPNAGALLRWLGADATDTQPHIHTFVPDAPGRVLVCSDGLYRYAPEPTELAAITHTGAAIDVAQALVSFAVTAGGHDNVTVVVLPYTGPFAAPGSRPEPGAATVSQRAQATDATEAAPDPADRPEPPGNDAPQ
jgi:serine/threonine protein phosphatase PrpC